MTQGDADTLIPLSQVKPQERFRIRALQCGRSLQARLTALGLIPGAEVSVISHARRGPLIIAVKQSRIMLGHGVANKIMVG